MADQQAARRGASLGSEIERRLNPQQAFREMLDVNATSNGSIDPDTVAVLGRFFIFWATRGLRDRRSKRASVLAYDAVLRQCRFDLLSTRGKVVAMALIDARDLKYAVSADAIDTETELL